MAKILVVDNYDSFVYNLVQYVGQLGAEPVVVRNDAIDVDGVSALSPDGILISPGPGRPEDAGISQDLVGAWGGRVPILGVCLGHQAIGNAFGAEIVRTAVMHGKTSAIEHDGLGVFAGLPQPLEATRYHSLVIDPGSVPAELVVSARTADGTVMGVRHRDLDIEGVQFHPESVLTVAGHRLVANWLVRCGLISALDALPAGLTAPATGG
jgi:anthranilate synthase/aminodeoxychorismate synthase-like glutamine amidotransferase